MKRRRTITMKHSRLFFLLTFFFSLFCTEFASAVSPTSWVDGQVFPLPKNFACPSIVAGYQEFAQPSQPTRILHDCRNNTHDPQQLNWIIVCPYTDTGGNPIGSAIWQGPITNLSLVPLNPLNLTNQLIGTLAHPECPDDDGVEPSHPNTNIQILNKLYFLAPAKVGNVLPPGPPAVNFFSLDLVTFDFKNIPLPFIATSLILTQVNHTLLLAQINAPGVSALSIFDLLTSKFIVLTSNLAMRIDQLTYDAASQTLSAFEYNTFILRTAIGVTSESLLNSSSTSFNWIFSSSNYFPCSTPLLWLRRTQQMFMVCQGDSFYQQSIMAFTVGQPFNATLPLTHPIMLLDVKAQPNLCGIASLVGTLAFKWNARTQTLYVACSSGSAVAISIQATNSSQPIVTSLISTGVCSQAVSTLSVVYSSPTNITIVLLCPEGLLTSSGRSLHLIGRAASLSPLLTFDFISQSIFLTYASGFLVSGTNLPSLPSVYILSGTILSTIMTVDECQPLSLSYSQSHFLLLCYNGGSSVTLFNATDGQIQPNSSLTIVTDNIQTSYQQTTFSTSYGFFLLINRTINYISMSPSIQPLVVQFTGLEPIVNSTDVDCLQIIQLDDGTLLVGLVVTTGNETYLYTISQAMIDENPQDWYMLQPMYTTTNVTLPDGTVPLGTSYLPFLVDQTRRTVWMLQPQSLMSISIDDPGHIIHNHTVCSSLFNTSAFAVDSPRGRVFVAWSAGDGDFSTLGVFNMTTGLVTESVSPTTSVTSQIAAMLMNPLTGVLTMLLQGSGGLSTQIVVYSDQWTCSAGMQWVDGSCQPCGVSTARGFIAYVNATQASPQCLSCDVGRFSNITGAAKCTPCSAGRYSNSTGSIICNYCEPNHYNNRSGLLSCQPCPNGTDSITVGSTACNPCQLGQSNSPGLPCATCALDTFAPYIGSDCLSCTDADQQGLQCVNGLAIVEEGWWAYQLKPGITKFITTQCPPSYCPGGALQQLNTTQELIYCQYPRLNSRDNWLCAECVSDHIPWGSSCEPCSHANGGLLTLVIILAILLVIFLLRASSAAGAVTILVFFVQVAALELGPVTKWIDWIQFANFGTSSTRSCLLPISPIAQNILTMMVPFMLFIILSIICFINYRLSIFFSSHEDIDIPQSNRQSLIIRALNGLTRDFSLDRYIGCMMAILIFCYTSVTVTCVKSLHCVSVAPNVNLLFSAPTISCSSNEYKNQLLPMALFFLIVYVIGFPFAMFIFLWRSSSLMLKRLRGDDSDFISSPNAIRFAARWSHFYRPYRNEIWFWQPIAMFRRFVFSLISVLLIQSPTSKNVLYGVFGLLTFLLHNGLRPFIHSRWNHLESIGYILLIHIAYLLTSQTPPFVVSVQVALFLLVVPFSAILVGLTIRTIWTNLTSKQPGRDLNKKNKSSSLGTVKEESTKLSISDSAHSLSDPLFEQKQL